MRRVLLKWQSNAPPSAAWFGGVKQCFLERLAVSHLINNALSTCMCVGVCVWRVWVRVRAYVWDIYAVAYKMKEARERDKDKDKVK